MFETIWCSLISLCSCSECFQCFKPNSFVTPTAHDEILRSCGSSMFGVRSQSSPSRRDRSGEINGKEEWRVQTKKRTYVGCGCGSCAPPLLYYLITVHHSSSLPPFSHHRSPFTTHHLPYHQTPSVLSRRLRLLRWRVRKRKQRWKPPSWWWPQRQSPTGDGCRLWTTPPQNHTSRYLLIRYFQAEKLTRVLFVWCRWSLVWLW